VAKPLLTLLTELAPPILNPFIGCSTLETAPLGMARTSLGTNGAGIYPLLLELPPKLRFPLL